VAFFISSARWARERVSRAERTKDVKSGKMARFAAFRIGLVSVGIGVAPGPVFSQSRQFGGTFAGITVGQDRLERARSLYGPGALATVGDVQSLCYYVEQDHSYLSVSTFERESRIRSVSLTTFADVSPGCRDSRIGGRHLTVSEGVALGDPMAKVLGVFGRPMETRKLRIGGRDLTQTDFRVARGNATCMFEQDKLVLISIETE
jgi:hypothetical protein